MATNSIASADELGGLDIEGVFVPPGLVSVGLVLPDGRPALTAPWDAAPGAPSEPTIRVAWMDPSGAALPFARAAREEAVRLFQRAAIKISWVPAGDLVADEVRVILLDRPGPCEAGGIVLGSTPKRDQRASHVWVHLPSVMGVLGLAGREPVALDAPQRHALGLALGRVIAHELVHAVAPAVPHGAGLMATRLRAQDLTSPELALPASAASAVAAASGGTSAPALAARSHGGQPPS